MCNYVDHVSVTLYGSLCDFIAQWNSTYPYAGHPDPPGPSSKFVDNSTKLACLETAGYQIKYSTVLWLLELHKAWSKDFDAGIYCK